MIEFSWEGSTETDIEIGLATFKYKGESFSVFMDNFTVAYDLRDFIIRVESESFYEAKNVMIDSLRQIKKI